MGSGIAQICAQHGLKTILFDIDENTLTKAKLKIDADLQSLADKKKIGADEKNKIISAIKFTRNSDDCIADLIIEAIVENAQLKADLINRIADINKASAIFATNTSSLSVTSIAEKLKRPEHFAGLHFFNPAPVMKLVEVVQTPFSTSETINILTGFAKMLGKVPVVCKDAPGFIVNHVARPYYLEALYLVEKGISDFNTIDKLMEATGFKMGPFKLMDLIGNDINYSVTCIVHEAFGKPPRLKPSPIQEEKVNEGSLGRKTGKGYYEYPAK
jgi:3-hydroxybutyryl-CoA dehydrogenase